MADDSFLTLEKMMDVAAFRRKLLSSNIANADTPGYKAKDIAFQAELEKAVNGTFSGYQIEEPMTTLSNRDGNTVNLDVEMAKVAETNLTYSTATSLMTMKFRVLKDVLRSR